MASGTYHHVTTNELRARLSENLNRAAFSGEPVIVTRRGTNIVGIISIPDVLFLEKMKKRRAQAFDRNRPLGDGPVGQQIAERIREQLLFL